MKPETDAWMALNDHAAAMLRPGFAQRTLHAARAVAPTFASQVLLSVATAAVCLTAICFVRARYAADETARNIAGWEEIAAESAKLAELQ